MKQHPSMKYKKIPLKIDNTSSNPETHSLSKPIKSIKERGIPVFNENIIINKSVSIRTKYKNELLKSLTKDSQENRSVSFENEELLSLWDELGVKTEYREGFVKLIEHVGEHARKNIICIEKKNLYKIKECVEIICDEMKQRKTLIQNTEHICNSFIDNNHDEENDYNYLRNQVVNSFKQEIQKINKTTFYIFKLISALRQLLGFQYEKKFSVKKGILKGIISSKFVVNLSMELTTIKYSQLCEKLISTNDTINAINLPFISIKQDDVNKYLEQYYHFIQETLIRNSIKTDKESVNTSIRKYITHIKQDKQYQSQFPGDIYSFTNNGLSKELHIVKPSNNKLKINFDNKYFKNENFDSMKYQTDENIKKINQCGNNKIIITAINKLPLKKDIDDYKSEFKVYKGTVSNFSKLYEPYIKTIDDGQKLSFQLMDDFTDYFKKYNTLIIIYKLLPGKNELLSLMILTPSYDSPFNFNIVHLSTKSDSIENEYHKMLSYVSYLFSFWNAMYIAIHYIMSHGKSLWNKDLSALMKQLNFKWIKVENTENGERFQIFKLINVTNKVYLNISSENVSNNNNYIQLFSYLFFESNAFSEKNNIINKANLVLADLTKNYFNKNTDVLEQEKSILKEIQYNENGSNEMGLFLRKNKISTKLNMNEDTKYFCASIKVKSSFKTTALIVMNKMEYLLINTHIEEFYDNKTKQLFYLLFSEKNYHYLICEMNDEFGKEINNYDNIYESFAQVYKRLEQHETSTDNSECQFRNILIPWFYNNNNNTKEDTISHKENESQIEYNTMLEMKTTNPKINNYSVHIKPYNNYDIIINNDFFFAIINDMVLEQFNIPCIYCSSIKVPSI